MLKMPQIQCENILQRPICEVFCSPLLSAPAGKWPMEKILLRDSPKKISYYASCLQIPKVRICLVIKKFIVTNRATLADGSFLAFQRNHNDFFCHGCQVHLEKNPSADLGLLVRQTGHPVKAILLEKFKLNLQPFCDQI